MVHVQIEIGTLENSCFVIMPFGADFTELYKDIICSAIESKGLICHRSDEIFSGDQIIADIWRGICQAQLIIAELTGKNPNVLYEVGLAHALGKSVIIITRDEKDVPFDLKSFRYIHYDIKRPFWGEKLKSNLIKMIDSILEEKNPRFIFPGIIIGGNEDLEEKMSEEKIPDESDNEFIMKEENKDSKTIASEFISYVRLKRNWTLADATDHLDYLELDYELKNVVTWANFQDYLETLGKELYDIYRAIKVRDLLEDQQVKLYMVKDSAENLKINYEDIYFTRWMRLMVWLSALNYNDLVKLTKYCLVTNIINQCKTIKNIQKMLMSLFKQNITLNSKSHTRDVLIDTLSIIELIELDNESYNKFCN